MAPTRRRNRRPRPASPENLAARLPDELRGLNRIHTPADLQGRLRAIGGLVGSPDLALPVFNAAGHSVADAYRQMLTPKET
jgi:hypothetical protein